MAVLHTLTNESDGVTVVVTEGVGQMAGKFGVSVRDDDSGEWLGYSTFYPTEERALTNARKIHAGTGPASVVI